MNQDISAIATHAFRVSHTEDGWITPFLSAVESATPAEAAWKPAAEVASVWELTAHAANYLENLGAELAGSMTKDHEDWPAVDDFSPSAWSNLQTRVRITTTAVTGALQGLDDLDRAQNAVDIAVHDAYHAGQVVKLRQLYSVRPVALVG